MAGVEAYLSIRKNVIDTAFNPLPFSKEVSEWNIFNEY
jgi:hypothetical protein